MSKRVNYNPGISLYSDVAKCAGWGCPIKNDCWRYQAPRIDAKQSYVRASFNKEEQECKHYWPYKPFTTTKSDE